MSTFKRFFVSFIRGGLVMLIAILFLSFGSSLSAQTSSGQVVGLGSVSAGTGSGKCEVPPAWTGPIKGKKRWVPTYVDKKGQPHAFCDRQTGIVIQRKPGTPLPGDLNSDCENENGGLCTWDAARLYCANLTVGDSGQKGWRLMYIQELAALVDINSKSCPGLCLPKGHPFKDVQSVFYWSASTDADTPGIAWLVDFETGVVVSGTKGNFDHAWCARGASAAATY